MTTASAATSQIYACHVCKSVTNDNTYSHQLTLDKKVVCCSQDCFRLYQTAFFRNWESKKPESKPKKAKKGHHMGNTNNNIMKVSKAIKRISKK